MKKTEGSKPVPKTDDQVKIGEHHKADVYVKAAKRYKDIMSKYLKREKPIPFHYSQVYCSPFNRRGAPLNMKYVWEDLIPNMVKDGVDSSRPKPGFVVDRTGDEQLVSRQSPQPTSFRPCSIASTSETRSRAQTSRF